MSLVCPRATARAAGAGGIVIAVSLVMFVVSCSPDRDAPREPAQPDESVGRPVPDEPPFEERKLERLRQGDARQHLNCDDNPFKIVGECTSKEGKEDVRLFLVEDAAAATEFMKRKDDSTFMRMFSMDKKTKVEAIPVGRFIAQPAKAAVADGEAGERERPSDIGRSVSHAGGNAGTLGCRVRKGETRYVLSNAHVLDPRSRKPAARTTVQPAAEDGGDYPEDVIGQVTDLEGSRHGAVNTMDAGIAETTWHCVGRSTPDDRTPKSEPYDDIDVNDQVSMYGRTSGRTTGRVRCVEADVCVGFSGRERLFTNQIVFDGADCNYGDSGALVVAGGDRPVGLFFAWNYPRTIRTPSPETIRACVATPIRVVLERFGVEIDDEDRTTIEECQAR